MSQEFYVRPIFCVRDVPASVAYYCEKLGFEKSWDHGDPKPIIAQVGRSDIEIILDSGSVIPRAAVPSVLTVTLHEGRLGPLHRELRDRGARILSPPFEVTWQEGMHQFDVEDVDGNILVFHGEKPG